MYFMPSYGRPNCFERLINSPGGMPDVVLIVNEDDPTRAQYEINSPWPIEYIPAGSRCVDAWNYVYKNYHFLPWFGLLADDHVPQTRGWHDRLVEEAGTRYLAFPNGQKEFPLMRNVSVLGGDFARAMNHLLPTKYLHNYADCEMCLIASDNGLSRPISDVFVTHEHWKFVPGLGQDATARRTMEYHDEDARRFYSWLGSQERQDMNARIRAWKETWK